MGAAPALPTGPGGPSSSVDLSGKVTNPGDYTLTDTHVNSLVDWLRHSKVDMAAYPQVNAWSKRCCERPAYKKWMSQA